MSYAPGNEPGIAPPPPKREVTHPHGSPEGSGMSPLVPAGFRYRRVPTSRWLYEEDASAMAAVREILPAGGQIQPMYYVFNATEVIK